MAAVNELCDLLQAHANRDKLWNDYKCRVRSKLVTINANQRATGGGPSNVPVLSPLEERTANILGKDVGPLADVRQDQFASNDGDGAVTVEVVDDQSHQSQETEASSAILIDHPQYVLSATSPVHVQSLPVSPVPSLVGQTDSLHNSPRQSAERVRRVREPPRRRSVERASRQLSTQMTRQSRRALDQSRAAILRIEEMRAEAALKYSLAFCSFSESVRLIAESIERFSQRVVNLACYALKLWGSTTQRKDLLTASARLTAARASLRLLDDAVALKTALAYGFGKQDGPFWGSLGVAGSTFTLAYLQAEKLSWLIDTGMLQVSKETEFKIRTAHKLFWSLSAFVGFIRSIRSLNATSRALKSPDRTKCASARFTQASLTTTKLLLDTLHAVSWLPPGWLWGSKLSVPQASGIATASAVLGLVIHYHGKRF